MFSVFGCQLGEIKLCVVDVVTHLPIHAWMPYLYNVAYAVLSLHIGLWHMFQSEYVQS